MFRRLIFELRRRKAYAWQVSRFNANPVAPGDIVFLGDSITQSGAWDEYFPGWPVRNWGVSGDRTKGVMRRLDSVVHDPAKIFLMIGTNDIGAGIAEEKVLGNVETILTTIAQRCPQTNVYLQSVLPRTPELVVPIQRINAGYQALAARLGVEFVDLTPSFADEHGVIRPEYCEDGLHLVAPGYAAWVEAVRPLVG